MNTIIFQLIEKIKYLVNMNKILKIIVPVYRLIMNVSREWVDVGIDELFDSSKKLLYRKAKSHYNVFSFDIFAALLRIFNSDYFNF